MKTLVLTACLLGAIAWESVVILPTDAQSTDLINSTNYQIIDRATAIGSPMDARVMQGRITAIDFTLSDETIKSILLGDPSRSVYTTDATIESGKAKIIYLRSIQKLNFPGATTAYVTNLTVTTLDRQGQTRNYVFNLIPSKVNTNYIGIRITSNNLAQSITFQGHSVTADDLEVGLQRSISYNYTRRDDPVVNKIRQMISLMRQGTPIRAAAQSSNVSIPLITALARIAMQQAPVPKPQPRTNQLRTKVSSI